MAKQGMKRPEDTHHAPKNEMPPVPEIQGKAKSGPDQKVFHTERPISKAYKVLDNDLARDNVENDMPEADLRDI